MLSVISSLTKNFTALIPGTTVEILDQDSKNVIQLIIAAYNVSKENPCWYDCQCVWFPVCVCERESQVTTQRDLRRKIRRGGGKQRQILSSLPTTVTVNEPPADMAGCTQAGFLILTERSMF